MAELAAILQSKIVISLLMEQKAEQALAEQYDIFAEMWSAKEALYKYHSKGGVDFVKDVVVADYDRERGVLKCTIFGGEIIEVKVWREDNLVIAVID